MLYLLYMRETIKRLLREEGQKKDTIKDILFRYWDKNGPSVETGKYFSLSDFETAKYLIEYHGDGLKDLITENTVYYEPHGYHDSLLKELAPIDVVITPLIDISLPLIGPIIRGQKTALELAKLVSPQVMLPTAAAGDVVYEGWLVSLLKVSGNLEDFRSMLAKENLSTRVLNPQPGEGFEVVLERRRVGV